MRQAILYTAIVANYGTYLSRKDGQADRLDYVGQQLVGPTAIQQAKHFRQAVIDDLAQAKIYLLDGNAANYVDSLREDVQQRDAGRAAADLAASYMREVEFPADLVWVEHDHRMLIADRARREGTNLPRNALEDAGLRGYLYDLRDPGALKVLLFRSDSNGGIIDPLIHLVFPCDPVRGEFLDTYDWRPHPHMRDLFAQKNISQKDFQAMVNNELSHLTYDMVLGFVLFALLSSPENGIEREERDSLSPGERKTAAKFGKTWLTENLRSHVTIRIGKEGDAHLREQAARREFEREQAAGRHPPTEHWVSAHERRYKSGKIVMVRAHQRGTKPDWNIPTRVMGPRVHSPD